MSASPQCLTPQRRQIRSSLMEGFLMDLSRVLPKLVGPVKENVLILSGTLML